MSVLRVKLRDEMKMAQKAEIIIIRAESSMVKIRRESNEELAPDQLPPVAGIDLDVERLENLRKVTFKANIRAEPKPKRVAKPRKKV